MSSAMKSMQLELNVDKSVTILFGKPKQVDKIQTFIKENKSLTLNGSEVKMKQEEKYLGDFLHSLGLSKSAEVTVNKRYGKCLKSVIELKSIIDDFRMHSLGGICAGIDIFNMTIFPVLTYNSSTWFELNKNTIKKLENVQSIHQRC